MLIKAKGKEEFARVNLIIKNLISANFTVKMFEAAEDPSNQFYLVIDLPQEPL